MYRLSTVELAKASAHQKSEDDVLQQALFQRRMGERNSQGLILDITLAWYCFYEKRCGDSIA